MFSGKQQSCPVHNMDLKRQLPYYSVISSVEQLDNLLRALNTRGFREGELCDNLAFWRPRLLKMLTTPSTLATGIVNGKAEENEGAHEVSRFDCRRSLVVQLLDLEEKVYSTKV